MLDYLKIRRDFKYEIGLEKYKTHDYLMRVGNNG